MKIADKFEIFPSKEQIILCDKTLSACRHTYNWALSQLLADKSISYGEISARFTVYKEKNPWLNEVSAQALIAELRNLGKAKKNFYEKLKKNKGKNECKKRFKKQSNIEDYKKRNVIDLQWGILPFLKGFPEFKNYINKNSFGNQQNKYANDKINDKVNLSNRIHIVKEIKDGKSIKYAGLLTIRKFMSIPILLHRSLSGEIGTVTISKSSTNRYFASICQDDSKKLPQKCEMVKTEFLGIDLGCKSLMVDSNGRKYERINFIKKREKRLEILQKRICKVREKNPNWKSSKRYKKLSLKIAKVHEEIKFQRKDYTHNVTTEVVNGQETTFALETLNIKGMIKNHKLSKSISDVNWGEVIRQIEYKSGNLGKNVVKIDRFFPSTQTCSNCKYKNAETKDMGVRDWECPKCFMKHDRDITSAINIRNEAIRQELG